jgi:hypothetical protein
MSHIKLSSLLSENIEITNVLKLENECKAFAQKLVQDGVVSSMHKDLTSSDVAACEYTEDIAEVIRNEVIKWKNTINARGGR